MTLDQLQVLQNIIQSGSFRAASQNLHRAQSAVSYAVRTLEDELGFPLFDRTQYRPSLTAQGRAFLQKVEELLAQLSELEQTARFLKLGYEPEVRISVSGLWPMHRLAEVLSEFKKKFPQTEIKIFHDVLSADQMLLKGRVDLAFAEIFQNALLESRQVFTVKMIPLCSPDSGLAGLKGKAGLADLKKYTQIILRSTSDNDHRSAQIFNPSNTISVGDFLSKKELMLAGLGWGFMPEHLVKEEIRQKKLVHTHSEVMEVPMSIAHNPNHAHGPCAQYLWDAFMKKCSEHGASTPKKRGSRREDR
jgi:DNA-binding transcriptional LysR family regulator